MKKIYLLLVALAIYLVILNFYIVPQQDGLTTSTELLAGELALADPVYQESLPIQTVDLANQGRSIIIAVVMITHIFFANLHLGGAWVAAISESFHLHFQVPTYKRLARSLTLFNVMLFSAGATLAVGGMLFFFSLYPVFSTQVFHIYWWPLLAEAILFGLQILFLYSYWFSWDKIGNRAHQALGYAYAISVFFQTLMINMLASGMLTPGASTITWGNTGLLTMPLSSFLSWWVNPSVIILQLHRLFAAISYFGFLMAMLGMFHYFDRKDRASKRYWDWVGSFGIIWGLLGLMIQPVLGLAYMRTILQHQPGAFNMIMLGARAWEMLLMVGLLSFLFITVIIYFLDRREPILTRPENTIIHTTFKVFLGIAVACGIILVQPAYLSPFGLMFYKFIALFLLVTIGALMLGIDAIMLGEFREAAWGDLSSTSRSAALIAGVLGMWIVAVMGYVRESARAPWLVYGIVPVPGGQSYPTPLIPANIFGVWLIITVGAVIIFWFTSRVTAYHPEEAEEI